MTGVNADRELPVVWAVAKGSFRNKAILVPAALAISAFLPFLITPLLMLGGLFLCFEGVEKLAHRWLHSADEDKAHHADLLKAVSDEQVDMVAFERDKIKGAIRTDFILSAEIIVISLGTVADASFATQLGVLVGISLIITIGVYGLVGGIVKLDDMGLWLHQRAGAVSKALGSALLFSAPYLMKTLSVVGTIAMFLVGGGILMHGLPALHHLIEPLLAASGALQMLVAVLADGLLGVLAGALAVFGWQLISRLRRTPAAA